MWNSNPRPSILGLKRNPGFGASALTDSTEQMLKTFATRFEDAPMTNVKPILKNDVFERSREIALAVCIDAASDELLGAKMMNTPELRKQGSLNKLLPAYRFTIRDGTHAGRRIIARGWGADKNLKHTAGVFGRYRHSLGQRLHHRPKYRQISPTHVTKSTFCGLGTSSRRLPKAVALHQ